jgi:hypothetical protein
LQSIIQFDVPIELRQRGVSAAAKEGKTILIVYNDIPIRFDIEKTWLKTAESFQNQSKPYITDDKLIQSIIFYLSNNWLKMNTATYQSNVTDGQSESQERSSERCTEMKLETEIPHRDYTKFIIETIKKTVKREDVLIRQVLYTGLSTYTFEPLNLAVLAPTSEGKTYGVTQVMKLFPKEDVWYIGSMSTKVLVRQKGILVDSNHNPIKNKIRELTKMIDESDDKEEKSSLKEQLDTLMQDAKMLIDLKGKTLIFLERPQPDLWNLIKPILSHDVPEIEYPYVDKTEKEGIATKKVVVRGWCSFIFCSARDESSWEGWSEIQSRCLITSPNMSKEKYFDSNILIAQRKGLPNLVQQRVIISDKDIQTAKTCVLAIKQNIDDLYNSNNASYDSNTNSVWIPYYETLASALQSNKGTDNRTTIRIFSLLNIIAMARSHLRPKLIFGKEKLVVATLEDLAEALHITQNVSGIPTHKVQFYRDIFNPLYYSKTVPDMKDGKEEKRIGVTTSQLCKYYKSIHGKTITSNNLKQTFLNELINNGYIDEEDSELDRRQKIYFPLVDISSEQTISNYVNPNGMDNFLQYKKIILPKNCKENPDNWLKFEILELLKHPIQLEKFQLLDLNGNETCICQFIKDYEKNLKLNGFFVNTENNDSYGQIFGKLRLI